MLSIKRNIANILKILLIIEFEYFFWLMLKINLEYIPLNTVTAGAVDLKEINFKNMSSKILPNFYVAGEVLNIDAVTVGFNFQSCWSEAWLIAQDLNNLN